MALRAVIDHPKFTRLKSLLKLNRACTLGYLEALWHFCGRFTPQGNIGKYSIEDIESWVEWDGEEGALVAAMVKARWLDEDPVHGLIVHDWHKHADDATRHALKRAGLNFTVSTVSAECPDTVETPSGHSRDTVGDSATPSGLPEPEPEPVPEPVPVPEPEPGGAGGGVPPSLALVVNEPPWFENHPDTVLARIMPPLLACRSGGKQVFVPESFSEGPMLRLCERLRRIAPDIESVDLLLEDLAEKCSRHSKPPYSDPARTIKNWLDIREPDWLKLRAARAKDHPAVSSKSFADEFEETMKGVQSV